MAKRFLIEFIYPDYDDFDDFILHTNQGTFLISKKEIEKLKDIEC